MKINDAASMQGINYLDQAKKTQEKAIANISATRAIDATDGASMAIADALRTQGNTIDQGIANSYDAIGVLQIADSSLNNISKSADRINELSVRSNNAILNESQRTMIRQEANVLKDSINQSFDNATFNGKNVFQSMDFTLGSGEASFNLTRINSQSIDVENQDSVQKFMDQVGSLRADIGAGIQGINANINASIQNSISSKSSEGTQLNDDVVKNYSDLNQGFLKENAALFAQAHNTLMLQTKMASLLA